MNVEVTRAGHEHAEVIARFNQKMALETEDKPLDWNNISSGVENALNDPSLGFYLVAINTDEDAVVGCLAITYEWSDWRNGLFWWIQSVYIDEPYRRQGVFRSMYAAVKDLARQDERICGIRLYVEKENVNALSTYVNLGMTETHYRLMEEEF